MRAFVRLGDGEAQGVVEVESCYNDHWSLDYVLAPIIAEGLCSLMGYWTAYHSSKLPDFLDGLADDDVQWEEAQAEGDSGLAKMAMVFASYEDFSGWADIERRNVLRWALKEFSENFERFWE